MKSMSEPANTDLQRSQLEKKSRLLLAATVLASVAIVLTAMSLWVTPQSELTSTRWMWSGSLLVLLAIVVILNLVAYRRVRTKLSAEGATSEEPQHTAG